MKALAPGNVAANASKLQDRGAMGALEQRSDSQFKHEIELTNPRTSPRYMKVTIMHIAYVSGLGLSGKPIRVKSSDALIKIIPNVISAGLFVTLSSTDSTCTY